MDNKRVKTEKLFPSIDHGKKVLTSNLTQVKIDGIHRFHLNPEKSVTTGHKSRFSEKCD